MNAQSTPRKSTKTKEESLSSIAWDLGRIADSLQTISRQLEENAAVAALQRSQGDMT